jgi:hypothetical protein
VNEINSATIEELGKKLNQLSKPKQINLEGDKQQEEEQIAQVEVKDK